MGFIETYTDLFRGNEDFYAISRDWEKDGEKHRAYFPSNYDGPKPKVVELVKEIVADIGTPRFNAKSVTAHLKGSHFLGVYPIREDSTVVFFALDFDKDEVVAREEARRQQKLFKIEAGLDTYIERSRSGNGYHLWGFLEEPVNAGELRFALSPFIEDTDTYDRMFPNQDGVSETKKYGNLIALPLYGPNVQKGNGVFVEVDDSGDVIVIDNQRQYLQEVKKIKKATIRKLFDARSEQYVPDLGGKIRKGDPEALSGLHKVVHPELGCEWIRWCYENPTEVGEPEWYALACQLAQLTGGREAFHEASCEDPRYDVAATDDKFDHALAENSPHRCSTIRDTLKGPACTCDKRFPDYNVQHPYDLAKVPFYVMLEQLKLDLEPQSANEGLLEKIQQVKNTYRDPDSFRGIPYYIPEIDQYTELREDDLIICAARPGRGKTAFMVDLAYRLARNDVPVYIYSMEMSRSQFWLRLLARGAGVDGMRLDKGTLNRTEWKKIIRFEKYLQSNPLPIYVDDTTYDATELVNKASEQIAEFGKGVVMIDYLQMAVNEKGESPYEKNSRVPRQYKLLAKGMHVPVFCLAQMNREGEDLNEDSETLDSVLEGSGKIEQYADVIWFLLGPRGVGIIVRVLVQHKDRHREAGRRIRLDFHQAIMKFSAEGTWAQQAAQANQQMISSKGFFGSP